MTQTSSASAHNTPGAVGHFHDDHLGKPVNMYVAWIDIMGTKSRMSISSSQMANFSFKLFSIIQCLDTTKTRILPFMDGLYLLSEDKTEFRKNLNGFFRKSFHMLFCRQEKNEHKCMIRACVAYGSLYQGDKVEEDYKEKDSIVIGLPIVQAFESEKFAPPFGIFVHESAISFGEMPFVFHKWFTDYAVANIKSKMDGYYKWAQDRASALLYDSSAIEKHKKLFDEYIA